MQRIAATVFGLGPQHRYALQQRVEAGRAQPALLMGQQHQVLDDVSDVVGRTDVQQSLRGDQVALPRADVGELIALFLAGAYGASASPATFLGQGAAREILV